MPQIADTALTGPALHEAKRALRAQMIAARDALDRRRARGGVAGHRRAHRGAAVVRAARAACCVTLPFGSEWDTRPLARPRWRRGKTLVRAARQQRDADARTARVTRHRARHGARVSRHSGAVARRCRASTRRTIDWVLVPGVAFEPEGTPAGLWRRLLRPPDAHAARRRRRASPAHSTCRSSRTSPPPRTTFASTRSSRNPGF